MARGAGFGRNAFSGRHRRVAISSIDLLSDKAATLQQIVRCSSSPAADALELQRVHNQEITTDEAI